MTTRIYVEILHYVGIIPLAPRNLLPFGDNSDIPLEIKSPDIPSGGFLFDCAGASELIPFGTHSDLCRNYSPGTSELIPFGTSLDIFWDLRFPDIPSQGFFLVFPHWDLLSLLVCVELHSSRWWFTILLLS